jgi:hypothetical protein
MSIKPCLFPQCQAGGHFHLNYKVAGGKRISLVRKSSESSLVLWLVFPPIKQASSCYLRGPVPRCKPTRDDASSSGLTSITSLGFRIIPFLFEPSNNLLSVFDGLWVLYLVHGSVLGFSVHLRLAFTVAIGHRHLTAF